MIRGYFIDTNDANINEILEFCVQNLETARRSLDGTVVFIKLMGTIAGIPSCLDGYVEYNHDQAKQRLDSAEFSELNEG